MMNRIRIQPHTAFLIFALFFGLIFIFLLPVGAGNDEETHFARIYEISLNHPLPNSYLGRAGLPQSFYAVSYRQQKFLAPLTWEQFQNSLQYTVRDPQTVAYRTRATYSPLNYIFQAALVRIFGWYLSLPIPILYYLLRLTYLLLYVLLTALAVRILPIGKWLLVALALAPITLLQAATVSSDPITNGVSFLFIAWALHLLICQPPFNRKITLLTFGLLLLLFSVKVNSIPLLLLLLLLSPRQFPSHKAFALFWAAVVGLLILVAGGWNLIAWQSDAVRRGLEGTSPLTVLLNSLKDPLGFIASLLAYSAQNLPKVFTGWIAAYGYDYWPVPALVFVLYPLGLLGALAASQADPRPPTRVRVGLLVLFALTFFGTFALRLILKQNMTTGVVSTHGRYYVAVFPLLLLGLTAWGRALPLRHAHLPLAAAFLGAALSLYTAGMGLSYYTLCGSSRYTGQECLLPVYKNWAPSPEVTLPLTPNAAVQQTFIVECPSVDQISVRAFNPQRDAAAGAFTAVLSDLTTGQSLISQEIPFRSVPANGSITLQFPPLTQVNTHELAITLTHSGPFAGLQLAVTPADDYRGTLSLDQQPQNADLLFRYRCQPSPAQ